MFRRTIQMDKYYANGKLKGIFKMSDYLHYQGFKFIFRTYLNNLIKRHYQLFMKFLYDLNPHKTIKNYSLLEYMLLETKLFIEFYIALNKNLSSEDIVTRNHLIIQVNIVSV